MPENVPHADMNQTLQYIVDHNSDAVVQGRTIDTTTLQPPNWPATDTTTTDDHHHSHVDREARIRQIFHWIATERPEQCIAVVSHFCVLRAALASSSSNAGIRPKNGLPIPCQLFSDGTLRVVDE